jgi:hypothetical protein
LADGIVVRRAVLSPDECAAWVRGVYAAREHWTPNFDGVQFTVGRAWYTHLEEDTGDDYFAQAPASDALVERFLPGLQARMLRAAGELVDAPIARRSGWCGPGVHVFPAAEWLAENGGDLHFDTEGLLEPELAARTPAWSLIVMLQPPESGGGLRVWEALYAGVDIMEPPRRTPHVTIAYGAGDLVAIDSYRLHQIQPFGGARDRISATAHLVKNGARWQCWF